MLEVGKDHVRFTVVQIKGDLVNAGRPLRFQLDIGLDRRIKVKLRLADKPAEECEAFLFRLSGFCRFCVVAHVLCFDRAAAVAVKGHVEVLVLVDDLPIHDLDLRIRFGILIQNDIFRTYLDHKGLRVILVAVPCELVCPLRGLLGVHKRYHRLNRQRHPGLHEVASVSLLAVLRIIEALPGLSAVVAVRRVCDIIRRNSVRSDELIADPVSIDHSADARICGAECQSQVLKECSVIRERARRVRQFKRPHGIRPDCRKGHIRGHGVFIADSIGILAHSPSDQHGVVLCRRRQCNGRVVINTLAFELFTAVGLKGDRVLVDLVDRVELCRGDHADLISGCVLCLRGVLVRRPAQEGISFLRRAFDGCNRRHRYLEIGGRIAGVGPLDKQPIDDFIVL